MEAAQLLDVPADRLDMGPGLDARGWGSGLAEGLQRRGEA